MSPVPALGAFGCERRPPGSRAAGSAAEGALRAITVSSPSWSRVAGAAGARGVGIPARATHRGLVPLHAGNHNPPVGLHPPVRLLAAALAGPASPSPLARDHDASAPDGDWGGGDRLLAAPLLGAACGRGVAGRGSDPFDTREIALESYILPDTLFALAIMLVVALLITRHSPRLSASAYSPACCWRM